MPGSSIYLCFENVTSLHKLGFFLLSFVLFKFEVEESGLFLTNWPKVRLTQPKTSVAVVP